MFRQPLQLVRAIRELNQAIVIPLTATTATLTFWHLYDFEYSSSNDYFDGGVLEFSTDGGSTWTDAAPNITAGGYTGIIATVFGNPLGGRAAWVFTSPTGWGQVRVDLTSYRGSNLSVRRHIGTDNSNAFPPGGWWVDDVQVTYEAPPAACDRAWSSVHPYPIPAYGVAVVSLDGQLYAFGGRTDTTITNAYRYAPETDAWTIIASLPEPRLDAAAVTDGTYAYILGGAGPGFNVTSTLWRYDPAANSYLTLAPFTTAVDQSAAVLLDGVIYRIGGETDVEGGSATATVE